MSVKHEPGIASGTDTNIILEKGHVVPWTGTDLLDTILMFGTQHSQLCHGGWMGVLRTFVDMTLGNYRGRDMDPKIAETTEDIFATGDPTLTLAMVLLFIPSTPDAISTILQFSNDTFSAAEFIETLIKLSTTFLNQTNEYGEACSDVRKQMLPSHHAYVMACRAAWVNR